MDPDPSSTDFPSLLAFIPALSAATFATATAVLSSLSHARRAALIEGGSPRDQASLLRYQRAPERVEGRWLWLRVVGVAATSALVATEYSARFEHSWLVGLGASLVAYAVPSEVLRPFATKRAEKLAAPLLRFLRPFEYLIAPISDPIALVGQLLARTTAQPSPPSQSLTESEVEKIVDQGEQDGSLAHDQSEMIRNVLDFGDLTARDVMVPRIHVDALDAGLPLGEIARIVQTAQHSRYPVFTDSIDNITGILHVKDLFPALDDDRTSTRSVSELARAPVAFVPETMPASNVLRDMRAGRHHMAVVVDEFGGFSGIVTLEDLLEEIVGDIQDEHDLDDVAKIQPLGDDGVLVDASLPVADLNRKLGTDLPESEDYVSLGGFLVETLGSVPAVGSTHEIHGLTVGIVDADRRHIARVELRGLPPRPPSEPPTSSGEREPGVSAA